MSKGIYGGPQRCVPCQIDYWSFFDGGRADAEWKLEILGSNVATLGLRIRQKNRFILSPDVACWAKKVGSLYGDRCASDEAAIVLVDIERVCAGFKWA